MRGWVEEGGLVGLHFGAAIGRLESNAKSSMSEFGRWCVCLCGHTGVVEFEVVVQVGMAQVSLLPCSVMRF